MRALSSRRRWAVLGAFALSALSGALAMPPEHGFFFADGSAAVPMDMDIGGAVDDLDVIDPGLSGKIGVLRIGSEVGENNLLSVFVGLKNKTAHRLDLEIETIYQDRDGHALNAGSWIAFTLRPHEEKEYRSASISEEAVNFLIRVRGASSRN
jgi:hypothetical protein